MIPHDFYGKCVGRGGGGNGVFRVLAPLGYWACLTSSDKNAVELGYNVMEETEYFVSL
jgi:hypothetical protein